MKKRFTIIGLLLLIGITVFSQVSVIPQGFNYQAIARDSIGSPRVNQTINVEFTIKNQTGTSIPYVETQSRTTDQFGLFTAVIGQGTQTGGTVTFNQIDWKAYNYYIKIRIQEGINYYEIGTEPLLTVPYAMVAKEAINSSPVGTISAYAGTTPPSGWLLCDGQNYLKTDYPDLYNLIGITYGGVAGANFNVPDFRGMFLRGAGTNGTQTKANGAAFDGGAVGGYQADTFQGHWHILDNGTTAPFTWSGGFYTATSGGQPNVVTAGGAIGVGDARSDVVNGTPRTGTETKPASYSVNYIIKY